MQGSKSEFFQKSTKKQKWDDGTGKKPDSRKFNKQKRRSNQNEDYFN